MKDLLHPVCLAIAGTAFLLLLRSLGKGRRDPALVALTFSFACSALCYFMSLTWAWVRIDGILGVPNIAVPLAQGFVLLVLALQATVLAYWSKPADAARRRGRQMLITAAFVIAGMAVLFALLAPTVERPFDFSLYYAGDPYFQAYLWLFISAYTAGEVYLARSCWKYARTTSNRSIAVGLRLVAIGATLTLGYSAVRIGGILGAVFGFSVKSLAPYAWLCGDVGAALTQIGYFLPTLARRIEDGRTWASAHLAYRRLQHLWAALTQAHPGITLLRPDQQRGAILTGRSALFPLLRRRTEIRHGQKLLRRYLDPAVRAEAEARHTAKGLTGPDLVAAVTADQIHAALIRFYFDAPVETPVEYADAGLPLPTAEDELLHLERVASYFTPPRTQTPTADASGAASTARS